jgi:hypothetical protein
MFGRRSSHDSSKGGGYKATTEPASAAAVDFGYGEVAHEDGSSDSDWPDDMSDKESLQSWAKEQKEKEAEDDHEMSAIKEEQHLRRWFLAVPVVLLLVGVGVSLFTFYYLSGNEQKNFERAVSGGKQ